MGGYFATQADWASSGRKCAQSEASEKILEASSLPREGREEGGGSDDRESQPVESRTQVLYKLSESSEGTAR